MIIKHQARFPALNSWLEKTIHELLTVFALPREQTKRVRTTNGLERYHGEMKQRTHVVRIFSNRACCLRLISAPAMERSKEWMTSRRYLRMDAREEIDVPIHQLETIIPEAIPT